MQQMFPPEESPFSGTDFSTRPISEIIAFLKTWRPQGEQHRQTVTALAQECARLSAMIQRPTQPTRTNSPA
jgi:hypothetical protein